MAKLTRTEWLVNKLFTNRGWKLVVKNAHNIELDGTLGITS